MDFSKLCSVEVNAQPAKAADAAKQAKHAAEKVADSKVAKPAKPAKKASAKVSDAQKAAAKQRVADAKKRAFRRRIKDALEETETTDDAAAVAIDALADAPAEEVIEAIVDILGGVIDELSGDADINSDEVTDEDLAEDFDEPAPAEDEDADAPADDESADDIEEVEDSCKALKKRAFKVSDGRRANGGDEIAMAECVKTNMSSVGGAHVRFEDIQEGGVLIMAYPKRPVQDEEELYDAIDAIEANWNINGTSCYCDVEYNAKGYYLEISVLGEGEAIEDSCKGGQCKGGQKGPKVAKAAPKMSPKKK